MSSCTSGSRKTLHSLSHKPAPAGAIGYALKLWSALAPYRDEGRVQIENNAAERAVALGCKNYLFAGSDAGGERAAVIFSLIRTATLVCDGRDTQDVAAKGDLGHDAVELGMQIEPVKDRVLPHGMVVGDDRGGGIVKRGIDPDDVYAILVTSTARARDAQMATVAGRVIAAAFEQCVLFPCAGSVHWGHAQFLRRLAHEAS